MRERWKKMKTNIIWGIILLLAGFTLILTNFGIIEIAWDNLWPLVVLIVGLLFEFGYFISRKDVGLLVPGGILTTYGIFFLYSSMVDWSLVGRLWPIYPLGVAIGLFQLYLFGGRDKGLLVPVGILSAVSLIFLFINFYFVDFRLLVGIIFVVIGIVIIFKKTKTAD